MKRANYLCEVCLSKGIYKPARIVHHKIELTPDNINNPKITLDHANLQAVCRECHAEIHEQQIKIKKRYFIMPDGRVIPKNLEKNS